MDALKLRQVFERLDQAFLIKQFRLTKADLDESFGRCPHASKPILCWQPVLARTLPSLGAHFLAREDCGE